MAFNRFDSERWNESLKKAMDSMKISIKTTISAAALFCFVVWFADPLILYIIALGSIGLVLLPAGIIGIVRLVFAIREKKFEEKPIAFLRPIILFELLLWVSVPVNGIAQEYAVTAAKTYVEGIAPLLEGYKTQTGVYPNDLKLLSKCPSRPRLLRSKNGYHTDGRTYHFTVPQPGGMINYWHYDSTRGTWTISS